jgi:hypothetical protein
LDFTAAVKAFVTLTSYFNAHGSAHQQKFSFFTAHLITVVITTTTVKEHQISPSNESEGLYNDDVNQATTLYLYQTEIPRVIR